MPATAANGKKSASTVRQKRFLEVEANEKEPLHTSP